MKREKGITLIALIVTIIVLLILAAVSINLILGQDGIINKAKNATKLYSDSADNELHTLNKISDIMNKFNIENTVGNEKVSQIQDKIMTENTTVTDEYGNKIVVPEDFKVTNDTDKVTEGIVIEDGIGNQFVWVPVGEVTDGTKTVTIKLSRYTFASDGTSTDQGSNIIDSRYQELATTTRNTTAKDLQGFIDSTNANVGYYIGRYEAYDNGGVVGSKAGQTAWTDITQSNAATSARNMYVGTSYTSDLVNSYAWDTAIVFIQEFGTNSNYANEDKLVSKLLITGGAGDSQLNINDMAGNVREWTTETSHQNRLFGCH